jgi:hypothetical protein
LRSKVKNPAPLLNVQACGWVGAAASPEVAQKFLSQKEKSLAPRSKGFIKHGSPWFNSQTFPIILPNTIHGCKKKDL